ncbi:putative MYND finger family protein [Rosellinia necatrix]|uniref:Putative MYND finger family protein n=1 Tax=Rosellinia necatrix TaxID=77044 RepID=A0A1S8A9N7_ROSNE|nr:putative MYND finger family protein [Rosellinia necatrix]
MLELGQRAMTGPYRPSVDAVRLCTALDMADDVETHFTKYMRLHEVTDLAASTGLTMKVNHTIVDAWPMRFPRGRPGQEAKDDFAHLLASNHTGHERYLEWGLADNRVDDVK